MNFSHLYSSALDQELGSAETSTLFTTDRRKGAINRGLFEFCDLTGCAVRQSTITCSNGVGEYNLNSTVILTNGDYLRPAPQMPEYHLISSGSSASTQFQAGDLLLRREIPWLNQYSPSWRSSTGATPEAHYYRADGGRYFVGLTPPPRIGSSQVGKIVFPYLAKPSSMTETTNVPFTFSDTNGSTTREDLEPYHAALVHYAAHQLEKLRRDFEASDRQLQMFLGFVERYKRNSEPVGGMQIRQARNYFSEVRRRRGDEWGDFPLGNLT